MRIAVAGATGRVGHHVVDVLAARGHDVVAMSRATGVDIITGAGLADALAGADAVVDTATTPSPDELVATEFFTTSTANLLSAGKRAGVRRLVRISIIGADRFTAGYGRAQVVLEQAVLSGPIPAQILRAAQFHEFVGQLVEWGRQGGVSYLPKMRTQLVAARTVAEKLADLVTAADADWIDGAVSEIAGPREENLLDMATLLSARLDEPVSIAAGGDPADPDVHLMESGGLLPGPHATLAGPTFEEWLAHAS